MDKRTIIGIVIIAAVLILMPYYLELVNGKTDETTELTLSDTSATSQSDITATENKPFDERSRVKEPELLDVQEEIPEDLILEDQKAQASMDTIPVKEVYIRTSMYDVLISTDGADITSMKSRKFLDLQEKPLEFCSHQVVGPNFPLNAYSGKTEITSVGTRFVTDKDSLILTESDTIGEVTFVGLLKNGLILKRIYHFNFQNNSFVHTTIIGGDTVGYNIDESVLWWKKGLEPSSPDVKQNVNSSYRIGYMMGGDYSDEKFSDDKTPKVSFDGNTEYVATHNKYFVVIITPVKGVGTGVRSDGFWYESDEFSDKEYAIPALGIGLAQIGGKVPLQRSDLIYIGPRDHNLLKSYGRGFEETVDLGWSFLAPLTKLFLYIFEMLYGLLKNYGLVIVVFSILIKLLLYPLSKKQLKSMAHMKELEPKMAELREKYKSDVKKLNEETMKLYQKEGVNPLGGCLPLLPQMPIFFALFSMLRNSFALRGSPFIFWIQDLAQKDPYYILPILMGITMFVQQKITVKDPKQKMMVYIMPAFFLFLFRNMPSGLVLYWLTFNILSLAQTLWIQKTHTPKTSVAPVAAETSPDSNG